MSGLQLKEVICEIFIHITFYVWLKWSFIELNLIYTYTSKGLNIKKLTVWSENTDVLFKAIFSLQKGVVGIREVIGFGR